MNSPLKPVTLSQKNSGNYVLGKQECWKVIATCKTPKELFEEVQKLGSKWLIKAEYSRSQGKTLGCLFTKQEALKAFGLPASKLNIQFYFENHGRNI